jgi:lysophospholipase L1-like esterase
MKKLFVILLSISFSINGFYIAKGIKFRLGQPNKIVDPAAEFKKERVHLFRTLPILATDIVFMGSSLTEAFPIYELCHKLNVKNRGIGGATTYELSQLLPMVIEAKPSKVFIEIGINDIKNAVNFSDSIDIVLRRYEQFAKSCLRGSPNTTVYIQSVLPVNEFYFKKNSAHVNDQIGILNSRIKILCGDLGIEYLDLYPHFLSEGKLDYAFTYDGVHLTTKGYLKWYDLIKQKI